MADKASDFSVRKEKKKVMDRMKRFTKKYERLDDALFVLARNKTELNRILKAYERDLLSILLPFFGGRPVEIVTKEAHKEFIEGLKGLTTKGVGLRRQDVTALLNANKTSLTSTIKNITRQNKSLLKTKFDLFSALANAARQPLEAFETVQSGANITALRDVLPGLTDKQISTFLTRDTITVKGKKFSKQLVEREWNRMVKTYGRSDTVQFRNGTNFPLRSYVDMKTNDMSREVQNMTVIQDSSANGVLTLKVSSHGASDSCRVHEGETVFINEAAKTAYRQQFPKDKFAARMRTVEDLKQNATHILKFNCKHRLLMNAIQFFADKDRQKVLKDNPHEKPVTETEFKKSAA